MKTACGVDISTWMYIVRSTYYVCGSTVVFSNTDCLDGWMDVFIYMTNPHLQACSPSMQPSMHSNFRMIVSCGYKGHT